MLPVANSDTHAMVCGTAAANPQIRPCRLLRVSTLPSKIIGTSPDESAAVETEQEIDDGREEPKRVNRQQKRQEVSSLRARGAELAERLEAARTALASARERREFMEEEAEQAREYGKKLAQEMSRLARIDQSLPPDQASAVEKLRRLLATLTEIELQEETTLEDGRAQEAALRAEIDDFTGGTRQVVPNAGKEAGLFTAGGGTRDILELEGASKAVVVRGGGRGQGKGGGAAVLAKTMDDPLAVAPKSPEMEADERRKKLGAVVGVGVGSGGAGLPMVLVAGGATGQGVGGDDVTGKKNTALEGKALLAEGLHRIEAAHEAAAAEREAIASRLSRLRLAVARRQREEDATPGHSELLQYLLRFEELGRHSLERQEQLRRCKAERSTMALTTELLVKEARLLETIASGVDEAARGSKGAREAYLRQVNGIVQGVQDSLTNQTRLLDTARSRRQAAEKTQESVGEDRKRFLAASRDLAVECYRYEALNAHLALMRR
eukprot:jgi/Undpi1/14078/HiC_scaffold_9.g03729.m1